MVSGKRKVSYEYKIFGINTVKNLKYTFRLAQVGVVSYGSECPSHGVYARVTEVKHWIQFIAQGAEDTNCNQEIPQKPSK